MNALEAANRKPLDEVKAVSQQNRLQAEQLSTVKIQHNELSKKFEALNADRPAEPAWPVESQGDDGPLTDGQAMGGKVRRRCRHRARTSMKTRAARDKVPPRNGPTGCRNSRPPGMTDRGAISFWLAPLTRTAFFGPILQDWEGHAALSLASKGKLIGLTATIVIVTVVLAPLTPLALSVILLISSLSVLGVARMPGLAEDAQTEVPVGGRTLLPLPAL